MSHNPKSTSPTALRLTRRSKAQAHALMESLKRCLRDTEQCYFTDACRNDPVKAHVLSKSWLESLQGTADGAPNRVYAFGHPDLPGGIHGALNGGNAEAQYRA